ncbi:MAG: hypothetical protein GXY32_04315 [Ruminococcaceae bacterium]|nr:hypothetical protein [Oscillospiraceae bacterium]
MFEGEYTVALDWFFRFELPQPYIRELRDGENEPCHFYFLPEAALLLYPDRAFMALVLGRKQQQNQGKADPADIIRRLSMGNRVPAFFTKKGTVKLPRALRRGYRFTRGGRVRLKGRDDHIEISIV